MSRLADIGIDAGQVARAADGDPLARRALYDAVAGPVFALVMRIVRDRATAEDLFQDVMETMFRRLGAWRGEAPLGFWVRQIAVRRCLMHLRSPGSVHGTRSAICCTTPNRPRARRRWPSSSTWSGRSRDCRRLRVPCSGCTTRKG